MSILSAIGAATSPLTGGWSLHLSEPDAYSRPGEISPDVETVPAPVPGTVAAALEAAGRFDRGHPEPLIGMDAWYRRPLDDEAPGPAILRLEGLATVAEVFLDDALILSSESMFESHDVAVDLTGRETLSICFRALRPHLEKTGPRARWRPRLMSNQGLRTIRTTALGFMPGWSPEVHAVGPWRPVFLIRPGPFSNASDFTISATLTDSGTGMLRAGFAHGGPCPDLRLLCDGRQTGFTYDGGRLSAELHLPNIKPWWPHTHGEPHLYDVTLRIGKEDFRLLRTGFRSVTVDRGADGRDFALIVNGERIFCRGAVWTTANIVTLPGDRAACEPWLMLAREAGMNMIRIPGIAVYESADFFALCDELGLMVWQDFMFANFDYPAVDPGFLAHVRPEVSQFLAAMQSSPSLSVLCGGSEIYQQGAMLGLPERVWKGPFCEDILAGIAMTHRPDLPYVSNSPSGGALPFYPDTGVAHYYGVGAYRRPLDDARRANVRFAAECLAFSNLSESETLGAGKSRIPRDTGADWDFEDVRDHYLIELYDVAPQALRRDDFERYLALSRAVTGEVMEAVFAEWRRPVSSCNGALVFTFQDIMPGPGWGVVDVEARPKPAWFALKRALRPVQVIFSDESTNGLDVHLLNETAADLPVMLEVVCLRDGKAAVVSGRRELILGARSGEALACTHLFGAFFDTNYAYRFGPPSHDVTVARLSHAQTGETIAEAFHFPIGRARAMHDADLFATLVADGEGFWLELSTDLFAQSVRIEAAGYRMSDNGFHLRPGVVKKIRLVCDSQALGRPAGSIRSLGSDRIMHF